MLPSFSQSALPPSPALALLLPLWPDLDAREALRQRLVGVLEQDDIKRAHAGQIAARAAVHLERGGEACAAHLPAKRHGRKASNRAPSSRRMTSLTATAFV